MAKPKVTLVKKSQMKARATGAKAGAAADFVVQDNEDNTVTIGVVDLAGVPITDPAVLANITLTAVSADPTKVTVDAPVGLTAAEHALAPTVPGTPVVVSFTATWSDGSFGPFTVSDPIDVTQSGPGSLVINHGTPTVR